MTDVLLTQANALHLPLRDQSVHCCVTSPPYWGLRQYNCSQWIGGDATCPHSPADTPHQRGLASSTLGGGKGTTGHQQEGYREQCPRCGAVRVDSQLGLEPLHDCNGAFTGVDCGSCYICRMRQVFAEVFRVLRDDGTLFLVIGDSYFSGNARQSNSHKRKYWGGFSCGTSDKGLGDCQDDDSSLNDLCDGCQEALSRRTSRNDGQRAHESDACVDVPSLDHTELPGSFLDNSGLAHQLSTGQLNHAKPDQQPKQNHVAGPHPSVQGSKNRASSVESQGDACVHCANCGACFSVLRSSSRDAQLCVRRKVARSVSDSKLVVAQGYSAKEESRHGIEETGGALVGHISDTASDALSYQYYTTKRHHGQLKPKDLCGIPWRLALALQADGWTLRSEITWCKSAPMPESVRDRPTTATEKVFLFSKSPSYFYDAEAVRVQGGKGWNGSSFLSDYDKATKAGLGQQDRVEYAGRNLWNYWVLGPEPFAGQHYACFPTELARRCILAGTSAHGACADCGTPWERMAERTLSDVDNHRPENGMPGRSGLGFTRRRAGDSFVTTLGWAPPCTCQAPSSPAIVLDPFCGSGTTLLAARALGRHGIGCDLSYLYLHDIARKRLSLTDLAAWEGRNGHVTPEAYTDLPLFTTLEGRT